MKIFRELGEKAKKILNTRRQITFIGNRTRKRRRTVGEVRNSVTRCNDMKDIKNFGENDSKEFIDEYDKLVNERREKSCFINTIYDDTDIDAGENPYGETPPKFH